MSEVLVIQHIQYEPSGIIGDALTEEGIAARTIRLFEGHSIPREATEFDGLVIMGGPMGVYEQDRYPFLAQEIRLIRHALEEGKPVLGICLGSQLLAAALGSHVTRGEHKEIGWYPVTLTEAALTDPLWADIERSFVAYHWHGDIFDLPQGAVSLASSAWTRYQAFRYGSNAYGILFHMEVTERIIQDMVKGFRDELAEGGIDEKEMIGGARDFLPGLQRIGRRVFQRWAGLVSGGRPMAR